MDFVNIKFNNLNLDQLGIIREAMQFVEENIDKICKEKNWYEKAIPLYQDFLKQ